MYLRRTSTATFNQIVFLGEIPNVADEKALQMTTLICPVNLIFIIYGVAAYLLVLMSGVYLLMYQAIFG
jgi:hypothetical protein